MVSDDADRTLRRRFQQELVEQLDPDALIFTTFNFSETFFENNILGFVGAETKRLQTVSERRQAELWAEQRGVSVFFEPAMYRQTSNLLTYRSFPVTPAGDESGVFHPKLIIASGRTDEGRRRVRLMVTSANLTKAGWGQNREVAAVIDVEHRAVAAPLAGLLRWMFRRVGDGEFGAEDRQPGAFPESYADVLRRLDELAETPGPPDDPELVVSVPGAGADDVNSTMMQHLARTDGDLKMYSPYLSQKMPSYLDEQLGLDERAVQIVPATRDNLRIEATENWIDAVDAKPNLSLAMDVSETADDGRFDHLKVYEWSNGVAVGSHNATEAALGRRDGTGARNVEASLLIPGGSAGVKTETVGGDKFLPTEAEDIEAPGERGELQVSVTVVVDWEHRTVAVSAHPGDATDGYSIWWPGMPEELGAMALGEAASRSPLAFEAVAGKAGQTGFARNKAFEVWMDGETVYRGRIVERRWREFRRDEEATNLRDCLSAWQPGVDFTQYQVSSVRHVWRQSDNEAAVRGALSSAEAGLFDNYYFLYQATRQMMREFEEVAADTDESGVDNSVIYRAVQMLHKQPGSLTNIIDIVEESVGADDNDDFPSETSLFEFLLINELQVVTRAIRGYLEAMPQRVVDKLDEQANRVEAMAVDADQVSPALTDEVGRFLLGELDEPDGGRRRDDG